MCVCVCVCVGGNHLIDREKNLTYIILSYKNTTQCTMKHTQREGIQKWNYKIFHELVCKSISKRHIFSILFFSWTAFFFAFGWVSSKYQEVVNCLIIDTDKMAPQWCLATISIGGIFLHPKQIHTICQKHVHAIFTPRWMRISAQNKHICLFWVNRKCHWNLSEDEWLTPDKWMMQVCKSFPMN